ncbi:MAG: glutamate--cysteine ligase [Actinomycetota bacterium]|jgi:glutamate---cysteine ligase / carboxylate-amine ligase
MLRRREAAPRFDGPGEGNDTTVNIEFKASPRCTLGVEVELQLVDRATGALASVASAVLAELGGPHPQGEHPKAKHELFECCIEIVTGICETAGEARADLAATLAEVTAACDRRGVDVLSAGTHPFSSWHDARVSPNPRYEALVDEMAWVARRLQIFGVHFHVGVRSGEKAIAIANVLRGYIPHFLALSASSPFWEGRDTGMASSRSPVFENLPTAGLPYVLAGWGEFENFMATLISAGAISTIREVWWDIRPHPDFGTVELRICDGVSTLREVAGLAALAQCLVHWVDRRLDAGVPLWVPKQWTVRQNKWRAARHGTAAMVIADETGRQVALPDAVAELLDQLAPVAAELGCSDELAGLHEVLDRGPSYSRQRAVVDAGGDLTDVVASLVAELKSDQ